MAQAHFWDGTQWVPISGGGGGGGGTGPQGPQGIPGLNGESVTVYGPQVEQPVGPRKGDIWFVDPPRVITVGPTGPTTPPILVIPGGGGGGFGNLDITNVQGSSAEISTINREEDQ